MTYDARREDEGALSAGAWMELYGTPDAPKPSETGWTGFSHPTRKQWAQLRKGYNAMLRARPKTQEG